jgi:hypothetical protein
VLKSTLQLLICNEPRFDDADKDKPVDERKASGGATDGAFLKVAFLLSR